MTDSFFQGKRPWSKIKDRILGRYMPPYLSKIATLHKPILIIDAFAGPGKFDDGSAGSPLIICRAVAKHARNQSLVVFVNSQKKHHQQLEQVLQDFIKDEKAIAIYGMAAELLENVINYLDDATLFLYLDPFGLAGCEFDMLKPFFQRDTSFSTEIVINISVPAIHRLACRNAVKKGNRRSSLVSSFITRLNNVLGGDYWQDIMWGDNYDMAEVRVEKVVEAYKAKVQEYGFNYNGSCPVREKVGKSAKYFITFFSRHPDAMLLMNDIMCASYQERMHMAATEGTLFEGSNWETERDLRTLRPIILNLLGDIGKISRIDLWLEIVQKYFMIFRAKEFNRMIKELHGEGRINFDDIRGTGKLNDDSLLYCT